MTKKLTNQQALRKLNKIYKTDPTFKAAVDEAVARNIEDVTNTANRMVETGGQKILIIGDASAAENARKLTKLLKQADVKYYAGTRAARTTETRKSTAKLPAPDVNIRTGKKVAMRTYDDVKYYKGLKNTRGEVLTDQMLRAWAKNPNRKLECQYDGEQWPANYSYCPRCREYKGLMPYIPKWSEWTP